MDGIIKSLAANIVNRLDEIENHTDFALLLSASDSGIRDDAKLLQKEIGRLKACLKNI